MSSLSTIPNILFSQNPFLKARLFDIIQCKSVDRIRKTAMNVKYWYASMPDECKSILHKVVHNETFRIHNGIYYNIQATEQYRHGRSKRISTLDVPGFRNSSNPEALTLSEALDDGNLKSISCPEKSMYSLVDPTNNFVFLVSTKTISLIDDKGDDIVILNTCEQHALIIYAAIRGLEEVKQNILEFEQNKMRNNIKAKITEAYGVDFQK